MRDALTEAFRPFAILFFTGVFLIPFGVWKVIELIIWAFKHIHIGVTP